jgi:type I restriction enzyme M protein
VTRDAIEAKNYDLKAVNPNAKSNEDTRRLEELIAVIEAKGKEVNQALVKLRKA